MIINTIEPYRYNYFKKRIEITSEVLPILKNSYLTDIKNVKLLLIYVNEPVLYMYNEKAKIVRSDSVEQIETPKKKGKLSEVFEYFITSLFYDLLVGEFNDTAVCMSRTGENDVNMSVLISELEYDEANEILKNPSWLVREYKFKNWDIETESEVVNGKKECVEEIDICEDTDEKENVDPTVSKENDNNTGGGHKIENRKVDLDEDIDGAREEPEIRYETDEYRTVEMGVSGVNRKNKSKKNVFRRAKDKLNGWFRKERKENSVEWEGDPGHLIFGSKDENDVVIVKKIKLEKVFLLDSKKDLEILYDLVANEYFYVEVQSAVKLFIVKEEKMKILVNANVSLEQEEFVQNIEKLSRGMRNIGEKKEHKIEHSND